MLSHMLKDTNTLAKFATLFMDILRKEIKSHGTPADKAFAAVVAVHTLLSTGDESGFVVYNHEETMGPQYCDLFRDADDQEFLHRCMEDALEFSRDDVSFRDIDSSRRTFIATLCRQVLYGLPNDNIAAEAHILRQIAATFNGMNAFQCKFLLTYCQVKNDSESFETDDISDFIIV